MRGNTGFPRLEFRHSSITRSLWYGVHECELVHGSLLANMIASASVLGNPGFDATKAADHVADLYTSARNVIPYMRAASSRTDDDTEEMVAEWRRMDEEARRAAVAQGDSE